jgi:hypothetical protein
MRRAFVRVLVSLLTFAAGVCFALLLRVDWGGFVPPESVSGRGANPASSRGAGGEFAGRYVLYDARLRVRAHGLPEEEFKKDGEALLAVNERVLPEVFPRGYLEGTHSRCDERSVRKWAEGEAELEWARAEGYFVPQVARWQPGSLTEARADEILYQVNVRECNAQSGPLYYGSTQLAVYRAGALHASVNTLFGEVVYVVPDLDGDGVDEVLMSRHEYYGPSGDARRLRLVSLKGGAVRMVHDFGAVGGHHRWDEARRAFRIEAAVLSYAPGREGRPPEFRTELYRGYCRVEPGSTVGPEPDNCWPRPEEWEYVGGGGANE